MGRYCGPADRSRLRAVTTWYDFTTTRRNRSRNGIANVEWNLGMAMLEMGDGELRAFSLDERDGLCELDPSSALTDAVYSASPAVIALTEPDRSGTLVAIR